MKKLISMLLVLVVVFLIVGCGATSTPESEPTPDPIEEAKSMLEEAYETCCGENYYSYANLGDDLLSLVIDTNAWDSEYYEYGDEANSAIISINEYLGLPSSLLEKFSSTRALDGTQSQECGIYTVTWNYHPDNGLKVIYEVNLNYNN